MFIAKIMKVTVVLHKGEMFGATPAGEVVGKISDDAKWLKEGDEVEVRAESIDFPDIHNLDLQKDLSTIPYILKVKCPCCGDYK